VRNTSAESIASVLNQLLGSMFTTPARAESTDAESTKNASAQSSGQQSSGGLVVDAARNAILYHGKGENWLQLRPMMEEMDSPARLALVEVTIAEVTLTHEYRSGVEWALRNASIGSFGGSLSTLGGLGVGSDGVVWSPISSSGHTRAVINALARSDQVTILSTPRLLVRSGEQASINVGTEIPIISSEATRPDLTGGGTGPSLLRNVQMRKTGVLLTLEPIIHAGNRIDLRVEQEVSEAIQTDTSGIDSPSILDRSISTSLSLRDGGAVMLGGLITDNRSRGDSRVPGFGRIPVLGRLFRSDTRSSDRTELIIMIVPYILNDHEEAEAITRSFRDQLSFEELREVVPPNDTPPAQ
jgi:general secretion pathway protein D